MNKWSECEQLLRYRGKCRKRVQSQQKSGNACQLYPHAICHSATLRHWANPSRQLICALLTPSGLDSLSTLEGPVSPAICHPRHYRPAPHCSIFGNFRHLCASIHAPCSMLNPLSVIACSLPYRTPLTPCVLGFTQKLPSTFCASAKHTSFRPCSHCPHLWNEMQHQARWVRCTTSSFGQASERA